MITFFIKTPLYVWPLLIGLIFSGIRASKTGIVPLKIFWILPIFFLTLSTYTVIYRYGIDLPILSSWFGSLSVGGMIGLKIGNHLKVKFDKKSQKVEMPGSWFTLILALTIFCSKFFIGIGSSIHPEWIGTSILFVPELFAALACGTFIGRSIALFKKYKTSCHTPLKPH